MVGSSAENRKARSAESTARGRTQANGHHWRRIRWRGEAYHVGLGPLAIARTEVPASPARRSKSLAVTRRSLFVRTFDAARRCDAGGLETGLCDRQPFLVKAHRSWVRQIESRYDEPVVLGPPPLLYRGKAHRQSGRIVIHEHRFLAEPLPLWISGRPLDEELCRRDLCPAGLTTSSHLPRPSSSTTGFLAPKPVLMRSRPARGS